MIEKSVAAGTACASFKGIAFDDCEYGYGYFASSRGATDPVTVCGGSAWCARGFGWGASIAGGTASGTAACAKLTEDLVEACTAGTKMTGYRDTTTVDRPVPFARDNVAAAAPKTS